MSDLNGTLETFVLEAYMPRTSAGEPAAAAARAHRAAAEMRRNGSPVRLLRSFFLPADELWFGLYEARSLEDAAEAGSRAELAVGRIQQAIELEPAAAASGDSLRSPQRDAVAELGFEGTDRPREDLPGPAAVKTPSRRTI